MVKKIIALGSLVIIMSGCAANQTAYKFDPVSTNVLNPRYGNYNHLLKMFDEDAHCDSFGCGKNLEFYNFEQGEQARRSKACGWEYGQTSSAYAPGTAEYKRLRAQEEAKGQVPGLCQ